jgi:hypothetical protein
MERRVRVHASSRLTYFTRQGLTTALLQLTLHLYEFMVSKFHILLRKRNFICVRQRAALGSL